MPTSSKATRNGAIAGTLAILLGCVGDARSASPWEPLLAVIVQRNAIADQVALSKWDSGKPVLDQAREAAVLQSVRGQAAAHGLEPEDAARFFAAEMESSKQVQYALLDRWHVRGHAPNTPRPDLAQLRAHLDRMQVELLDAFAQSAPLRQVPDCVTRVARAADFYSSRRRLDAVHRNALVRSLGDICE